MEHTFVVRYRLPDGSVAAELRVTGPTPQSSVPRQGDKIAFAGNYAEYTVRMVRWDIDTNSTTVVVYCG